ncbi:MAG: hypothetical protein ACKV2T_11570 [Kofleriaceae bacterium]
MAVDVDRFLGRLVGPIHGRLVVDPELSNRLAAFADRARAAWPQVEIESSEFLEYVAERIAPDANERVLEELFADDLYLALGCVRRDPNALRSCEQAYARDIERGLDAINVPVSIRDEVWSRLRARIFVATPEAPPAISTFTGRGSLKKWLRVAASRLALNVIREQHRETPLQDQDLPEAAEDLQLGHLKRTYQSAFKEAFAGAIGDLTPDQRMLLRMHLLDKLTIDDLARLHRVHRTSTARWLRDARDVVAAGTRRRLHAALGVADEELDSIMNIVRSRLDLSLSRLFELAPPTDLPTKPTSDRE